MVERWCSIVFFTSVEREPTDFYVELLDFSKVKMLSSVRNVPLPHESTCRTKQMTTYSTESGVYRPFVKRFLRLCEAEKVATIHEDDDCRVYPCAMGRDGVAVKPGLDFDPIRKVLVGASRDIDIEYVMKNPRPDPEVLKAMIVKDADTIVVTDLSYAVSVPVGVDYTKAKQCGAEVRDLIL